MRSTLCCRSTDIKRRHTLVNYGSYFIPALEPDVNCIAFRSEAELVEQLERVLVMHPAEIDRLRRGVIRYYEEHLSPSAFARRLSGFRGHTASLRVNAEVERFPEGRPADPAAL